ncbi:MAG: hypothetical protein HZB09_01540 [Candidatus Yonathbacteria bacterium]|nr:hypothetical protein [Candidatus Yonathbacteria bacterium]
MQRLTIHKLYFTNKEFLSSFFTATVLLFASFVVNFYAGVYATKNASNSVTDIILSNIRTFDVDWVFVYGPILFFGVILFLCAHIPQRIPFVFKSVALFVVIRAVFVSLTHIGPFPTQLLVDSSLIDYFSFSGDLFFSGHTGLPFLMALIFWDTLYLRVLFIISSIVFGIVVLLGHIHYSIDVLSAFFITYTIYHIAEHFFSKDQKIFTQGIHNS